MGNDVFVASQPVEELSTIASKPMVVEKVQTPDASQKTEKITIPCRLNLSMDEIKTFLLILSNDRGEEVVIGYDKKENQFHIDRTKSGKVDFYKEFAARHVAPRLTNTPTSNLSLIIDVASVELFADDGLTVMTQIFFPSRPFNQIQIQSPDNVVIKKLEYIPLNSIWP